MRRITEVWTADEVIKAISEVLSEADGDFIQDIAGRVLSGDVEYRGDSIFNVTLAR